ncbi:MAG: tellurite resistance TerB family protein [Defluviicoccus sp.]|nr:tellurite resistance TerB family protein [Defluviicoccus sp.]MDE0386356.1 tellurite resistance TerB family protein [Defluviicoccus sp.]
MTDHHSALIYAMVLASAADREMTDTELRRIGQIVDRLPVFDDFDTDALAARAAECAELLNAEDGLEAVIEAIRGALPQKLRETAYAVACEIVVADGKVAQEEVRLLEMLAEGLPIDRLAAAAIERGARARHMRL